MCGGGALAWGDSVLGAGGQPCPGVGGGQRCELSSLKVKKMLGVLEVIAQP